MPVLFPQYSSFPWPISCYTYYTTALLRPLISVLVSLENWKSSFSYLISPSSSLLRVLSCSFICHSTSTFYTDPSQNITTPHMYSSFPFSPCFILSYQRFNLPLFFSLLTLYQRHCDQLVSVLPPEQPRSLLSWLLPAPWLFLSYTSKLKKRSLCRHFLLTVKGVFPSL